MIMEALVISLDFTIEDIHKIREQNYERTKDKFFVCQFPILPQNTNKYSEWIFGSYIDKYNHMFYTYLQENKKRPI